MIDKTPAVGRIVVRKNDNRDHFINLDALGRITEIRGQQIKYQCRSATFNSVNITPRIMLMGTVAVVCDTDEELTQIVNFNMMAYHKISELRASLDQDWTMATRGAK